MKKIAVLMFTCSLLAQDPATYVLRRESSLSGSTEKLTVQQPTSGAKLVRFESATLYASVETEFTLSYGGTAATGTSLTPTALVGAAASTALGFRSSNAGSGTTIEVYTVPAGGTMVIDLSAFYLTADGTAQNLNIGTSSETGTVRISIKFTER